MLDGKEIQAPWWVEWATQVSGLSWNEDHHHLSSLGRFSRQCHAKFFAQSLSHAEYFQCSALVWTVRLLHDERKNVDAPQLTRAVQLVITSIKQQHQQLSAGEKGASMASWVLPSIDIDDLPTFPTLDNEMAKDAMSLDWMLAFWRHFYEAAQNPSRETPSAPWKKRQRMTYECVGAWTRMQNPLDGLMKGLYKLPTATWCLSMAIGWCETWTDVEETSNQVQKSWKTITSEETRAALIVVGLSCISRRKKIVGLTPRLLLEYLNRSG